MATPLPINSTFHFKLATQSEAGVAKGCGHCKEGLSGSEESTAFSKPVRLWNGSEGQQLFHIPCAETMSKEQVDVYSREIKKMEGEGMSRTFVKYPECFALLGLSDSGEGPRAVLCSLRQKYQGQEVMDLAKCLGEAMEYAKPAKENVRYWESLLEELELCKSGVDIDDIDKVQSLLKCLEKSEGQEDLYSQLVDSANKIERVIGLKPAFKELYQQAYQKVGEFYLEKARQLPEQYAVSALGALKICRQMNLEGAASKLVEAEKLETLGCHLREIDKHLALVERYEASAENCKAFAESYSCLGGLSKKIEWATSLSDFIKIRYVAALKVAGDFYFEQAKQLPHVHADKAVEFLRACKRMGVNGAEAKLNHVTLLK